MLSNTALSLQALSKSYTIRHNSANATLGEALMSRLRRPIAPSSSSETFWAVRNVSAEIQCGEVVGIVGKNGAGKSTLLKLLSRITEPTSGQAILRGRVGSLLEVGTGFHPELTGRENIYLNGAILGMSRQEITRHFDAIVAFAETEKFLDTPVKRYSSGMYVRLAFAVAAYLNPEILIVDEVLAVGDSDFQKRCLGRMHDVAQSGRTVLFVSHNMAAVRALCNRVLLMQRGELIMDDTVEKCLAAYGASDVSGDGSQWNRPDDKVIHGIGLLGASCRLCGEQPEYTLEVTMQIDSTGKHRPAWIAIDALSAAGIPVFQSLPTFQGFMESESGQQTAQFKMELPPMIPGIYRLSIYVLSHYTEILDSAPECVSFEILDSPTPGRTFPHTPDHGFIVPKTILSHYRGPNRDLT